MISTLIGVLSSSVTKRPPKGRARRVRCGKTSGFQDWREGWGDRESGLVVFMIRVVGIEYMFSSCARWLDGHGFYVDTTYLAMEGNVGFRERLQLTS